VWSVAPQCENLCLTLGGCQDTGFHRSHWTIGRRWQSVGTEARPDNRFRHEYTGWFRAGRTVPRVLGAGDEEGRRVSRHPLCCVTAGVIDYSRESV
jgi:hypothetical protein